MTTRNARNQARHRDRMRQQGLRLMQVWVPDTKAPGFLEEYRRQARLLAATYDEDLEWWLDRAEEELDEFYRAEP